MRGAVQRPLRRLASLWRGRREGPGEVALSDRGLVRAQNEDAWLARSDVGVFAVADGMGGHEQGDWASRAIVEALGRAPVIGDWEADEYAVAWAILQANAAILGRAQSLGVRIGSTIVALLLQEGRFVVRWAGDSRAYRLHGGRLIQLTNDHTRVQEKVALGLLRPERARNHPMAHILTRAIGSDPEVALDRVCGEALPGDLFLLCSDGLHGVVSDAEMERVLTDEPLDEAARSLVALCRARGAPDNITLVATRA